MKHSKQTLKGERFFRHDLKLYVNREAEAFSLSKHAHEFIELAYVMEGRGFHYVENEVERISPGQLFVIPIGVSHVFRPASADVIKEPLIIYNCIFTPEFIESLISSVTEKPILTFMEELKEVGLHYYSVPDVDAAMEKLFLSLYREYSLPQSGSSTYLNSLFLQLIVTLYRFKHNENKALPSKQDRFMQVLLYIEQHYAMELTLSHLTEKFQWSERHLQRLFKQHTNQSFHNYLQSMRIRKSCEQLRNSQLKISRIAESVGYKDINSFIGLFKRMIGQTPSSYRQQFK
ncbi:helix-turn-helix domain-containing protein [Paenibacillus sp. LMG 31458]|uniref:Helix-turn-helix domain-containing protein n=1 Tax=Paenibacillus phytorum TaxID=2654977 RepID=A0ABX1XXJ3_9BACL|nr:AraC family transcriptional regulator [Paenibacillus phytorum]NOU73262.1 helix-turn-helix domain-containing protein [Paenibacillus phytorum]